MGRGSSSGPGGDFVHALQTRETELWNVERGIDSLLASIQAPRADDLDSLARQCEEAATFLRDLAIKLRVMGNPTTEQTIRVPALDSAWDD
jgi:hypothetical protein